MPAVAKALYPFVLVTPGYLPGPLLGVTHHPGHLPDRIPNRHPPHHKQVGAQHRIAHITVETLQPRGLRLLQTSFLAHAWKYTTGFGITREDGRRARQACRR